MMKPNMGIWGGRRMYVGTPGGITPDKLPPGSAFGGGVLGPPQGVKPGMGPDPGKLPPTIGESFTGAKPGMSTGFGQMPMDPMGGLQGFAPPQEQTPMQDYDSAPGGRFSGSPFGSRNMQLIRAMRGFR